MVSKSLYESSMFSELRDGRVGVQCERTLRFLLFLLDGWSRHTGPRKELFGKRDNGVLSSIYFDKFAMLSFRLWDGTFRQRKKEKDPYRYDPQSITFPCPFQAIPGKHGPGPGRVEPAKGRKPIYLIDILYELQRDNLLHYFEVSPPNSAPEGHKDHRTIVSPALPVTQPEEFLEGFTRLEQVTLMNLCDALKNLGPSEIRALGTHSNYKDTIHDIDREFDYVKPHKTKLIEALDRGVLSPSTIDLVEYADEAWRKSLGNRLDYADGRKKLRAGITQPELQKSFETSQRTVDEIWPNNQIMQDLSMRSAKARAVANYLDAVRIHQDHSRRGLKGEMRETKRGSRSMDSALNQMLTLGLRGFPRTSSEVLNNSGEIKPEFCSMFTRAVQEL